MTSVLNLRGSMVNLFSSWMRNRSRSSGSPLKCFGSGDLASETLSAFSFSSIAISCSANSPTFLKESFKALALSVLFTHDRHLLGYILPSGSVMGEEDRESQGL